MRILFFVPRGCYPTNTGARLRNFHLSQQMSRVAEVTYLSFADEDDAPFSDERGKSDYAARVITVPRQSRLSPLKLAKGVLGRQPFTALNYTTPEMQNLLARLLGEEKFDAVQVEGMVFAGYLPVLRAAQPRPLLLCDWHNVDSELMARYAQHAPDALRSRYAKITAQRIAWMERDATPKFDAHLTVSDRDREFVEKLQPGVKAFTIENGTDCLGLAETCKNRGERRYRIVFVGSMDYHPNNDAALYFANEVWPLIRRERPDWVFTIVGRNPSPAVQALAEQPGIEVTGTVPEVAPYYREAIASVVPLRIGGGSRLKILESMAARVPIVSTRLGAEGLAVRDGETLLIRDTPTELAEGLIHLENSPHLAAMVDNAYNLVANRYDWGAVGANLRGIYEQLMAGSPSGATLSGRVTA